MSGTSSNLDVDARLCRLLESVKMYVDCMYRMDLDAPAWQGRHMRAHVALGNLIHAAIEYEDAKLLTEVGDALDD